MSIEPNAPVSDVGSSADFEMWGMKENTFCMLIHLAQIVTFVISIILWAVAKDKSPAVDAHGKIVINWVCSLLIYAFVSGLLCLVFIGFLFLIVLLILNIVFPIIGAVKANNGILWKYPLSIPFFKVEQF